MGSPEPQVTAEHFVRRLLEDGMLIESRCKWCGFLIIGKASQNLPEDEQKHISECPITPHRNGRFEPA
jgi:hypothetical protein